MREHSPASMEGSFCPAEPTAALPAQAPGMVVGSTQSWGVGPALPTCECSYSRVRKQPLLSVFPWHLSFQHSSGFLLGSRAGSSPPLHPPALEAHPGVLCSVLSHHSITRLLSSHYVLRTAEASRGRGGREKGRRVTGRRNRRVHLMVWPRTMEGQPRMAEGRGQMGLQGASGPWLGGSVGQNIVPIHQSCRFDLQSGHI